MANSRSLSPRRLNTYAIRCKAVPTPRGRGLLHVVVVHKDPSMRIVPRSFRCPDFAQFTLWDVE
jgi:hypothetical protein